MAKKLAALMAAHPVATRIVSQVALMVFVSVAASVIISGVTATSNLIVESFEQKYGAKSEIEN